MGLPEMAESIIRFEAGEMTEDEVIILFEGLISSGMIHALQGSYGRIAHDLMMRGLLRVRGEEC